MKKGFSCLSHFAALLCAFLTILLIPWTVLMYDLGQVAFDPSRIKPFLTDALVESDLIPAGLEWFSEQSAQREAENGEARRRVTEPDVLFLMSLLDYQDWKEIRAEVLSDGVLAEWVSATVEGFYAWVDTAEQAPQISWDMEDFKQRISSQHGINAMKIVFDKLAPCTQAEIDDFKARLATASSEGEVLYNLCRFPDPWAEDQLNDYLTSPREVVEAIPSRFEWMNQTKVALPYNLSLDILKQQLRLARFLTRTAWVVPAMLLCLMMVLVVRSWGGLGRWWGLPLTIAGLFVLVPTLLYRGILTTLISEVLLSKAPPAASEAVLRMTLRLSEEVFQPMSLQAVAMAAAGFVLIVFMLVLREKKQ